MHMHCSMRASLQSTFMLFSAIFRTLTIRVYCSIYVRPADMSGGFTDDVELEFCLMYAQAFCHWQGSPAADQCRRSHEDIQQSYCTVT